MMDLDFSQRQERFEDFCSELENLMNKYGVNLSSTGGVYVYSNSELKEASDFNERIVITSPDASSGDLNTTLCTNQYFRCES